VQVYTLNISVEPPFLAPPTNTDEEDLSKTNLSHLTRALTASAELKMLIHVALQKLWYKEATVRETTQDMMDARFDDI
jgi:hypothetical protein